MRNSEHNPKYLLLLEAGKQQVLTEGLLPAVDRYDTKPFRDVRVWRDAGRILPCILILSPVHDLIEPDHPIEVYDPEATKLEADVADMMAEDPENRELFRRHFTKAEHVLSVAEKRANRIFQRWLEPGETFQTETRGLSHKREVMRRFMQQVPQRP